MTGFTTEPGNPAPLGTTIIDDGGVNFALYSEHATAVELLLFSDSYSKEPDAVVPLEKGKDYVWSILLKGVSLPLLYAYRVDGPYTPKKGLRFNKNKMLVDPYAKAISGEVTWDKSLFGYKYQDDEADLSFSKLSSVPFMPKCVVFKDNFDWEGDTLPHISWEDTIFYETHIKGFSAVNNAIEEDIQGTYAALGSPEAINYLTDLGITAVELLPIHQHVDDMFLVEKDLVNYWGYSTLNYFSPDFRYAATDNDGGQVREFKEMVKNLHNAGIEVILDVVYNHTAEGNELGPTFTFKGIDNSTYYTLSKDHPRYGMDFSGCGAALNTSHPYVVQFVIDSLRYWVEEMHVDGFRFDLAVSLGRRPIDYSKGAAFFRKLSKDPVLSKVKLIAEPWDLGPHGYQIGNFPKEWSEWNGKYRDSVRKFWRGDMGQAQALAFRMSGSPDIYSHDKRGSKGSINFVTCHDGFTLGDLVSYQRKYNEANLEDNRDGADHNESWNCGIEGPTADMRIIRLRQRQQRNFLATLFFSCGVPMILGGDEYSRSQGGNNNSYCQDNELGWHYWDWGYDENQMYKFVKKLIRYRKKYRVFKKQDPFTAKKHGRIFRQWFAPDGKPLDIYHWDDCNRKTFGLLLADKQVDISLKGAQKLPKELFFIAINSSDREVAMYLPPLSSRWQAVLSSYHGLEEDKIYYYNKYMLRPHSIALLQVAP